MEGEDGEVAVADDEVVDGSNHDKGQDGAVEVVAVHDVVEAHVVLVDDNEVQAHDGVEVVVDKQARVEDDMVHNGVDNRVEVDQVHVPPKQHQQPTPLRK